MSENPQNIDILNEGFTMDNYKVKEVTDGDQSDDAGGGDEDDDAEAKRREAEAKNATPFPLAT